MKYAKQMMLTLLCVSSRADANNTKSHTFFSALPVSNLITNLTLNLLVDQDKENGRAIGKPTIQFSAFGGASTNHHGLRDFFFFGGKNNLLMKEAPIQDGGNAQNENQNAFVGVGQDLIGSDFNIQTFNTAQASSITIRPKQTVVGSGLTLRLPFAKKFWATLEIPVIHVRNDLDLTETYTYTPFNANTSAVGLYNEALGAPSIPVATMIQAFRQDGMLYGRIDGVQKKTAVADMTLKVGIDAINRTDLYLGAYGGLVLPTGNKPTARHMFEAIVGNNHHWGILGGLYSQLFIHETHNKSRFWLSWLFESEYLFANTQMRSFDLYNGPWTRYMQVFKNDSDRLLEYNQAQTPYRRTWGINYFTKKVTVKPGYQGTFNINIASFGKNWHSTFGFNTIVRQDEKVSLFEQWKLGPQIASLPLYGGVNGAGYNLPGTLQPLRNISVLPNGATQYGNGGLGGTINQPFYVQESNLNLGSAAHPSARSHTAYGVIGYYRETDHPQNMLLGTSYECGSQNAILHRWMIWGSLQITF